MTPMEDNGWQLIAAVVNNQKERTPSSGWTRFQQYRDQTRTNKKVVAWYWILVDIFLLFSIYLWPGQDSHPANHRLTQSIHSLHESKKSSNNIVTYTLESQGLANSIPFIEKDTSADIGSSQKKPVLFMTKELAEVHEGPFFDSINKTPIHQTENPIQKAWQIELLPGIEPKPISSVISNKTNHLHYPISRSQEKRSFQFGLEVGLIHKLGSTHAHSELKPSIGFFMAKPISSQLTLAIGWHLRNYGGFSYQHRFEERSTGSDGMRTLANNDLFIQSIRNWYLPLQIQYRIHPNWQLTGGASLHIMRSAISFGEVTSYRQFAQGTPLELLKVQEISHQVRSVHILANKPIHGWTSGVNFGLQYQKKSLQAFAQFEMGLQDVFRPIESTRLTSDKIVFAQIGFRYDIHPLFRN